MGEVFALKKASLSSPGAYSVPAQDLSFANDKIASYFDLDEESLVIYHVPCYPGWKVFLKTPAGIKAVESLPALEAFQKVEVPAGPWKLYFQYFPASWRLGRLLSVLALM